MFRYHYSHSRIASPESLVSKYYANCQFDNYQFNNNTLGEKHTFKMTIYPPTIPCYAEA